MKIKRTGLVLLVVALLQSAHLQAQGGDPNGWHEGDGSYLSFWQDFFVEDGGVVTAVGVSEEEYDNFGHFVHVTTTLHGGASNRVVTGSAAAKFFACAEASFAFQPGNDEGSYYNDVQYSWTCPYLGSGFSEFIPAGPFIVGASVGRYKKQIGFLQNYYVCPEDLYDVNCKEMLVLQSQLPAGTSSYPPYLGMITIDLAVPPAVPFVCIVYQTWVSLPCGQ